MTRSQQLMRLAEEKVRVVAQASDTVKKTYGGLCHEFPVMVRTCGLCQAVAFSLDKAEGNVAHALLLDHVADVLGVARNRVDLAHSIETMSDNGAAEALDEARRNQLARCVETMSTTEYMLATRKVVSAWLFFKRFAVSILKVKDARDSERT